MDGEEVTFPAPGGRAGWLGKTLRWTAAHLPRHRAALDFAWLRHDSQRFGHSEAVPELGLDAAFDLLLHWIRSAGEAASPAFSNGYHFLLGWQPPHVETTGYLLATLCRLAAQRREPEWLERARAAARWLLL